MNLNWNLLGEGGCNLTRKTFRGGSTWIFSGPAQSELPLLDQLLVHVG